MQITLGSTATPVGTGPGHPQSEEEYQAILAVGNPYVKTRCLSFLFPFVGEREVLKPELTGDYWDSLRRYEETSSPQPCVPPFLGGGGLNFVPYLIRVVVTGVLLYLVVPRSKS